MKQQRRRNGGTKEGEEEEERGERGEEEGGGGKTWLLGSSQSDLLSYVDSGIWCLLGSPMCPAMAWLLLLCYR